MPVTAKLSRNFYERLGDEIATELVDWFNAVDATYRADLERLNELNFQRFDAKVEQRFAQSDAKVERRFARFEQRFAEFEASVEHRMMQFQATVERRIAEFEVKVEQRFAQADAKLERTAAGLRGEFRAGLADQRAGLLKWMFGFWIATLVPLAGLILMLRMV